MELRRGWLAVRLNAGAGIGRDRAELAVFWIGKRWLAEFAWAGIVVLLERCAMCDLTVCAVGRAWGECDLAFPCVVLCAVWLGLG